jgi:hypothetical protein
VGVGCSEVRGDDAGPQAARVKLIWKSLLCDARSPGTIQPAALIGSPATICA